jgi:hypothetical protein
MMPMMAFGLLDTPDEVAGAGEAATAALGDGLAAAALGDAAAAALGDAATLDGLAAAGAVVGGGGAAPVVAGEVGATAVVGLHAARRPIASGKPTPKTPTRRSASRRPMRVSGQVAGFIKCVPG